MGVLFPYHLPEICKSRLERALRRDVGFRTMKSVDKIGVDVVFMFCTRGTFQPHSRVIVWKIQSARWNNLKASNGLERPRILNAFLAMVFSNPLFTLYQFLRELFPLASLRMRNNMLQTRNESARPCQSSSCTFWGCEAAAKKRRHQPQWKYHHNCGYQRSYGQLLTQ